jgi:small subunit ribosomal protein S17
MAETPDTPENDETPDAPQDAAEAPEETPEVEAVDAEEATEAVAEADAGGDDAGEAPAPPKQLSKREQRAAARHAEASKRPARTPEERQAERVETRKKKAAARRRRRLQEREKRVATRAEAPEPTAPREQKTGRAKVRQGIVVSDKADKTITVRIDVARRHRRYEKIVRSSSTLHAHDENNDANTGDIVRVVESRPLSRTKRWRLEEVLERAK